MKDVQQQGGPYVEQNVFVGLPRQLTVDTTNYRVLIHDGVTPGGHIVMSRDESDDRYQAASAELSGLNNLEPLDFGLLVRVAPGQYVTRSLTFSDAFLTSNLSGRNDNPSVALAPNQPDDLDFAGAIRFSGTVNSDVPWEGPTAGEHTGDTTGTHTGDVIGNVQGNTEGNHLGGLDARGAEVFFDANQIPPEAIAGLAAALSSIPGALPTGVILMWSGDATDIPAGYFLCDGTNGTPDLQGRFILASSDTADPHETGGATQALTAGTIDEAGTHSHTLEVDDHILTIAQMPAHYHGSGVVDTISAPAFNHGTIAAVPAGSDNVQTGSPGGGYEAKSTTVGGDQPHTHTASSDDSGNHTHVFTGANIGIIPPYYVLCYIMKG